MEKIIEAIIEWDVVNWARAIDYWSKNIDIKSSNYTCLELGGRGGGLSLWLAINGNQVMCSDLTSPEEIAFYLHKKYNCTEQITYSAIDAKNIPYQNKFDIVIFKSILGGISANNNDKLKKEVIDEIYKSLKPEGKLLFAENLESSFLHKYLRKKFVNWGSRWNYLKYEEIGQVFSSFDQVEYHTVGFFGAFGRSEKQRKLLGKIDVLCDRLVPKSKRYIVFGIAKKNA